MVNGSFNIEVQSALSRNFNVFSVIRVVGIDLTPKVFRFFYNQESCVKTFLRTFKLIFIMAFTLLRKLIIVELVLLFIQFSFGIWNTLFALVPLSAPFNFFIYYGGLAVLAHIVIGSLILVFGGLIILFSYKTKNPLILRMSALAVVFTISAIANGVIFLEIFSFPSLYYIDNDFSFVMAISFLLVFTVFFTEIYITKKAPRTPEQENK